MQDACEKDPVVCRRLQRARASMDEWKRDRQNFNLLADLNQDIALLFADDMWLEFTEFRDLCDWLHSNRDPASPLRKAGLSINAAKTVIMHNSDLEQRSSIKIGEDTYTMGREVKYLGLKMSTKHKDLRNLGKFIEEKLMIILKKSPFF